MRNVIVVALLIVGFFMALVRAEDTPAKATTAEKIDLTKDATYNSGDWTYTVKIKARGTRSEGVFGALVFKTEEFHPEAKANDWVVTPWGKLYQMGDVKEPWGAHGWMPEPKKNSPEGKQLDAPK